MQCRIGEVGVLGPGSKAAVYGRWDQMIATIRQKTGETMEIISSKIDGMIDSVPDLESSDKPDNRAGGYLSPSSF